MIRKIDPISNLERTATDLAIYLRVVTLEELYEVLDNAYKSYTLHDSYRITRAIYTAFKYRCDEVEKAMGELEKLKAEKEVDADFNVQLIKKIFSKGNWDTTSFNTALLSLMVKKLVGYDATVNLKLDVVSLLYQNFIVAIDERIQNENEYNQLQKDIINLRIKKEESISKNNELENKILNHQLQLIDLELNIQENQKEKDMLINEINILEETILNMESELSEKSGTIDDLESKIEMLNRDLNLMRKQLLCILPELEIKPVELVELDLSALPENWIEEAMKNATIAAKTTIAEKKGWLARNQELNQLTRRELSPSDRQTETHAEKEAKEVKAIRDADLKWLKEMRGNKHEEVKKLKEELILKLGRNIKEKVEADVECEKLRHISKKLGHQIPEGDKRIQELVQKGAIVNAKNEEMSCMVDDYQPRHRLTGANAAALATLSQACFFRLPSRTSHSTQRPISSDKRFERV